MNLYLLLIPVLLFAGTAAGVPAPVNYAAGQDQGLSSGQYVMNYDAGAALSESYSRVERLERNTEVRSYSLEGGPGVLEASIDSNVIGVAHVGWESVASGQKGRPSLVGRSIEDLSGVFSIEKFVSLWSGDPGQISVDWLPCV